MADQPTQPTQPTQPDQISVDLTKATDEELHNIKNEVMKRLVERARGSNLMADGYDRHGSGHSRATPPQKLV